MNMMLKAWSKGNYSSVADAEIEGLWDVGDFESTDLSLEAVTNTPALNIMLHAANNVADIFCHLEDIRFVITDEDGKILFAEEGDGEFYEYEG